MTGKVPGIGESINFKALSQATGISEAELRKKSNEELTQLISSTPSLEDVDPSQIPNFKSESIFTAAEKNDSWFKRSWNSVKTAWKEHPGRVIAAGVLGVGAVVGGVAAIAATGGMAAAALPKLGLAVVGMVGAGAIMQSCVKNEYHEQTVIVNFSFDDLLAAVLAGNENQAEILAQLIAQNNKLDSIILYLVQHGTQLDQIIRLLQTQGLQLEAIIQNQEELKPILLNIQNSVNNIEHLSVEQNAVLNQMLQTLISIDANTQLTNEQIAEVKVLMQTVIDMLGQIDEHNVNAFTQLMLKIDDVLAALEHIDQNNQAGFNQLLAQLMVIGGDIQALLDAVHENGETLNLILEKLGSINHNIVGMQGFLNNILAELINMHGDMNVNNEQNMQLMLQLIGLVGQNNELLQGLTQQQQAQFAQLMAQIMAIIGNQNNAQVSLETIINLIGQNNQLIVNMTNIVNGWQQQEQQQFTQLMAQLMVIVGNQNNANVTLNAILDAVQHCSLTVDEILSVLNDISNKMNFIQGQLQTMTTENRAFYEAVLAKLDGMSLTQQQAYLDIIQRMINIENGQGEQNQQMQVIIDLIQNLNVGGGQVDIQPILDAIAALGNNVTNQGTALAALLTQILNKLDSINNKVSVIQTVAGNILSVAQSTNGISQQILAILQQLADGLLPCNNDECCEQIIAILQEILDAILNGDWNHEGIIEGEWDDLLGK